MPVRLNWVSVENFMRLRGIEDANELAVFAETHRSNMFRIAQGKSLPNMVTLARMCYYLGCQPGDILNYEHSDDDLSKPHLLFGLFPLNQKVWTKFRKLDKVWRQNVGRWELKKGNDLLHFLKTQEVMIQQSCWKEGTPDQVIEEDDDGSMRYDASWLQTLRARLPSETVTLTHRTYHSEPNEIMDNFNRAEHYATDELVQAIEESFFKYATTIKQLAESEDFRAMNFEDLDQLEAVYKNDPRVFKARGAFEAHKQGNVLEISSVEAVTAVRLGCEIERDWHMLSNYATDSAIRSSEDLLDYVEMYAMPIHDMDKEISKFDRWIKHYAQRAKFDEAIAQDIAQGMDDKED